MGTIVTSKGQVTIPKHIRDSLSLKPGTSVVFDVNVAGEVVLRKEGRKATRRSDRFDRAVGAAKNKIGCSTDEYMELIRGYSEDPAI